MKSYALDLWGRAVETLQVAERLVGFSDDNAASRAYYAAFYAVSALFALEERTFRKHTQLEAAVHRDLIKSGRWPPERGKDFSRLATLRERGDYGGDRHVSHEEAMEATNRAGRIVEQVRLAYPETFKPTPAPDLVDGFEDEEEKGE